MVRKSLRIFDFNFFITWHDFIQLTHLINWFLGSFFPSLWSRFSLAWFVTTCPCWSHRPRKLSSRNFKTGENTWNFFVNSDSYQNYHQLPAKQWSELVCSVKTANISHHNHSRCASTFSMTKPAATSRPRNGHLQHPTHRPCSPIWSKEISSMYCRWSSSVAGSIGCFQASLRQKCHFHWHWDLSRCCSVALSCNPWTLHGSRRHRGISWTCLDWEIFTLWCWERTMVRYFNFF